MTDHLDAPAEQQPAPAPDQPAVQAVVPAVAAQAAAEEQASAEPVEHAAAADAPAAEQATTPAVAEHHAVEHPVAEQAPVADQAPVAEPPPTIGEQPPAVAEQQPAVVEQPQAVAEQQHGAEQPAAAAADAAPAAPAGPSKADERRERAQRAWERVVAAHDAKETLTGTVTVAVKGGLLVDIAGIRGFLPASQARVPIGTPIETLVKTRVPLKIIDVDKNRRRAVVSHRRAVEDERHAKRAELLRSLEVGQTREGTVVRLADFGAFVDLGGIDGLIPMRELAFERVDKVQDVLSVGDTLPVQVLRIEENGKKISLSRKNALPDPWRDHADAVRRGAVVQGKVVGKEPRLQVEIAPGIVGMVRESDADPAQYEIGEEIEVAVRSADRATRRIVLTTMHGAAAQAQATSATSSGFAPLGVELTQRGNRNRR